MNAVAEKAIEREQILTLNDRCDTGGCSAAALVLVKGLGGELMFCGHHYERFGNTDKMKEFAFEVIDERWVIQNENRLKD